MAGRLGVETTREPLGGLLERAVLQQSGEQQVTRLEEGDILGVAQSGGRSSLKLLRVAEHGDLIAHSREVAGALLDADPELQHAPGLREIIEQENRSGVLENLGKS